VRALAGSAADAPRGHRQQGHKVLDILADIRVSASCIAPPMRDHSIASVIAGIQQGHQPLVATLCPPRIAIQDALEASLDGVLPLKKIVPRWVKDSVEMLSLATDADLAFVSFHKRIMVQRT
jgi:hypothetical protein